LCGQHRVLPQFPMSFSGRLLLGSLLGGVVGLIHREALDLSLTWGIPPFLALRGLLALLVTLSLASSAPFVLQRRRVLPTRLLFRLDGILNVRMLDQLLVGALLGCTEWTLLRGSSPQGLFMTGKDRFLLVSAAVAGALAAARWAIWRAQKVEYEGYPRFVKGGLVPQLGAQAPAIAKRAAQASLGISLVLLPFLLQPGTFRWYAGREMQATDSIKLLLSLLYVAYSIQSMLEYGAFVQDFILWYEMEDIDVMDAAAQILGNLGRKEVLGGAKKRSSLGEAHGAYLDFFPHVGDSKDDVNEAPSRLLLSTQARTLDFLVGKVRGEIDVRKRRVEGKISGIEVVLYSGTSRKTRLFSQAAESWASTLHHRSLVRALKFGSFRRQQLSDVSRLVEANGLLSSVCLSIDVAARQLELISANRRSITGPSRGKKSSRKARDARGQGSLGAALDPRANGKPVGGPSEALPKKEPRPAGTAVRWMQSEFARVTAFLFPPKRLQLLKKLMDKTLQLKQWRGWSSDVSRSVRAAFPRMSEPKTCISGPFAEEVMSALEMLLAICEEVVPGYAVEGGLSPDLQMDKPFQELPAEQAASAVQSCIRLMCSVEDYTLELQASRKEQTFPPELNALHVAAQEAVGAIMKWHRLILSDEFLRFVLSGREFRRLKSVL